MAYDTVLGLDVGSDTIKAVVAESGKGKLKLVHGVTRPSFGLRRGAVVSMDEVAASISDTLSEIRSFYRPALKNIFLSINDTNAKSQLSRGIIAVSRANSEIHEDDVNRVIQASQAISLPQNRMVLHTLTREFIVDGVGDISDPLGMTGGRLEVVGTIIDAFTPTVKNIQKCVRMAGGEMGGLILSPLASARAVLNNNQKELGVVLIDIGLWTTGVSVYEEGKLLYARVFPLGSNHITNDLAVALRIPVEVAEKLKITHGYAISKDVPSRDMVDLKKIDMSAIGAPSRRFISEIIESRLQEIFELIDNDLKSIGKSGKLPGGVVLVGGGAKLPGIVELARQEFKLSATIGLPQASSFEVTDQNLLEYLESPEYANVFGLVLHSEDQGKIRSGSPINGFSVRVIDMIRNLIP